MAKILAFKAKQNESPAQVLRKVPTRPKNKDVRTREYLLEAEIDRLMKAAGAAGRHGLRDRCLILTAYRHGLRVSELVDLRWSQVDFKQAELHVRRMKNGTPSVHPIMGDELRELRKVKRRYSDSPFIFVTELGGPMTTSTVQKIIARAGNNAEIPFPVHPHMMRHSTGYRLVNDGWDTRRIQAYLGHRSIQQTVIYTQLSSRAFDGMWR